MRDKVSIKAKNAQSPIATLKDVELKIGKKVIPNNLITSMDIRVRPDEIVTAEVELIVNELDIDATGEVKLQ